jgi:hypothetical protein
MKINQELKRISIKKGCIKWKLLVVNIKEEIS